MTDLDKETFSPMETGKVQSGQEHSKTLRITARIISLITNPLLIPLVGAWLILHFQYFQFAGYGPKEKVQFWGSVFSNAVFLPGVTLLLLYKLKFVKSLKVETRKERIVPYITTMTFYFWAFLVFRNQIEVPDRITAFFLGNFLASVLCFLSNISMKVSLHMTGMGVLIGLLFSFIADPYADVTLPLVLILFITGLVGSARMLLRETSFRSLYMGVGFGIFTQIVALWIV